MNKEWSNNLIDQLFNLRENLLKNLEPPFLGPTSLTEPAKAEKTTKEQRISGVPTHIHETGDEIIVVAEIPGLQRREDIHLLVSTVGLELRGRRFKKNQDPKSEGTTLPAGLQEEFEQRVSFPSPVRSESATAIYRYGLLEVRLKKIPPNPKANVFIQFL